MATQSVTTAKPAHELADDLQCELEKARAVFELIHEEVSGATAQAAFHGAMKLLEACEADASRLTRAINAERSAAAAPPAGHVTDSDLFEPVSQLQAVIHHLDDDLLEGIEADDPEEKRILLNRAIVQSTLAVRLSRELAKIAGVGA